MSLSPVMTWLAHGLPISLLLDLAEPEGPNSPEIARLERADTSWVPAREPLRAG